jgi:uncharacterized protein (TIGR02246 family)
MIWKHTHLALVSCAGFAIVVCWFTFGGREDAQSAPPERRAVVVPCPADAPAQVALPAAPVAAAAPEERPADKEGVQKALDAFVAAFNSGDAKALSSSWTTEGEYIGDDGTTYRGRAALEKGYTEFFTNNKGNSLSVEVGSIRFPSKDTAVVEGHFKLRSGKASELAVSRCSFLFAREDGKWLIAIAREWPGDGLSLRDLEWLIGTWEAKRDGVTVTSKYEWTANKSFIRCTFTVKKGAETHTGMQMIVKDPSTGGLHQWTFEDSGGIGSSDITRDGKKWVHTARGVTPEGQVVTATNIMTPIDTNSFFFHAVERTLDDEELPDLPPVKVTRVKAKP